MDLRALPPILAAGALAALGVAGCGSTAAPKAHPAAASCRAQYENWTRSGNQALTRVLGEISQVQSDVQASDYPKTKTAAEHVGTAAGRIALVPRCADPKGYFRKFRDRLVTVGDNARSRGGVQGIALAAQPLSSAGSLLNKLSDELDRTVGPNR